MTAVELHADAELLEQARLEQAEKARLAEEKAKEKAEKERLAAEQRASEAKAAAPERPGGPEKHHSKVICAVLYRSIVICEAWDAETHTKSRSCTRMPTTVAHTALRRGAEKGAQNACQ